MTIINSRRKSVSVVYLHSTDVSVRPAPQPDGQTVGGTGGSREGKPRSDNTNAVSVLVSHLALYKMAVVQGVGILHNAK